MPERQRTLRQTIDWSYELLDEPERRMFARLSVFAGGTDLDATEAVANPNGELGRDTLDGLASLVDKSLVRSVDLAHVLVTREKPRDPNAPCGCSSVHGCTGFRRRS